LRRRKQEKEKAEAELKSGRIYLKIMQGLSSASNADVADYVASETARMSQLMSRETVDRQKKREFELRINILKSFL
jgi:Endoplasmic reticulum protein ERp29, C-terminal domain